MKQLLILGSIFIGISSSWTCNYCNQGNPDIIDWCDYCGKKR